MKYIKVFREISSKDVAIVGGKTASLGQMINTIHFDNVLIPDGFAITADAYWHFVNSNNLMPQIEQIMGQLHDYADLDQLKEVGNAIRNLFMHAQIPHDLQQEIDTAYYHLCKAYGKKNLSIAVRSSATAEDLPTASFAGQQESYLNMSGVAHLLEACKKCFASLFTDRAIVYRHDKNFDYKKIALSIAVQKMVRSDLGTSGVAFSLDTESGFKNVVVINASYGLGEAIVQGLVVPDEYVVFKPTLLGGFTPILKKQCGSKTSKIIYSKHGTKKTSVPRKLQEQLCVDDADILTLAKAVCAIEDHYTRQKGSWCPMDVEWAKDGTDGNFI